MPEAKKGVIDLEENEIIQNLFEFDDMAVDEFATHRTDITLLWTDETLQQWRRPFTTAATPFIRSAKRRLIMWSAY